MLEASVEKFLQDETKRLRGCAVKLNPHWNVGIPDRLIILPEGRIIFIETKRPVGGRLSGAQRMWKKMLLRLGCEVYVANTKEMIADILERNE